MKLTRFLKNNLPPGLVEIIRQSKEGIRRSNYRLRYYLRYRGDKVSCICCGKTAKSYVFCETGAFRANSGQSFEQYVKCPYCASKPRHRAECYLLSKNDVYSYEDGDQVILFAPEDSIKLYLDKQRIPYVTSAPYMSGCDLRLDLCGLDLPDKSYDLVFCNQILEHVPDARKAMQELARILSEKGVLFITVPIDYDLETTKEEPPEYYADMSEEEIKAERIRIFGQGDHLRLFGRDFSDILGMHFNVEVFDGSQIDPVSMPAFGSNMFCPNCIFICRKKG